MFITLTDETNTTIRDSRFFLVGGVAISSDSVDLVHREIIAIRTKHGYRPSDSLKYARYSKPAHISNEQFNEAKSDVLDLCIKYEINIFLYACHHLIAENKSPETKFQWGCNAILWQINQFLTENNSYSLVLQDRHPVEGEFNYYKRRFMESHLEVKDVTHKLDRIVGFGSTCDGASHLSSVADIALGSYRFCLNNPDKDIVNGILMPKLLRATWGYPEPIGRGIGIFPKRKVNKRECAGDYDVLRQNILRYINA